MLRPNKWGVNHWKGYTMDAGRSDSRAEGKAAYEAPSIQPLGSFHVETQYCLFGKQWGGHDSFAGVIGVPISNCSG